MARHSLPADEERAMAIPSPYLPPPGGPGPVSRAFVRRMLGAAMFDRRVYEDVESDPTATMPALGVVVLSSVAAGIALRAGWSGLVVGVLASLFTWYLWALVTWWIGTRLLPTPATRATQGELLRTLGFASAPGIVQVLGVLPGLARPAFVVAALWMLATAVVGVRQALDYDSTARAIAVVGIGWLVQWAAFALVLLLTRAAW
jgi:hypothetical protein